MLAYEYPSSLEEAIVSGEVKNPFHLARELVARGHELTVVSVPFLTRKAAAVTERTSVTGRVVDVPEGRLRGVLRYRWRIQNVRRALDRLSREISFDVIHAQSPALAAAALEVRRSNSGQTRWRVVTTAHGTYLPEVAGDRVRATLRERAREANAKVAARIDAAAFAGSDTVIAVSAYQRAEMQAIYSVRGDRLLTIYNGVDRSLFKPSPSADAAVASTLLFVGRLVPKKGVQDLLHAFSNVLVTHPSTHCVIVGGSPAFDTYGASLRALAVRLGVADRVTWLDSIAERDLPDLYRAATIAVFPSINYESLPTVALEAMACGVPVIATDAWGTPEALGPGHPGLVPQQDADALAGRIRVFLDDDRLRASVRDEQAGRMAAFDLDRCAKRHEEAYAST